MSADRNLLFGILALQMDFISRDQLVEAMNAWVLQKQRPLGEILLERGVLAAECHAALVPMVELHIARHGGEAAQSLAALSSVAPVQQALAQVEDADVQASLCRLGAEPSREGEPTRKDDGSPSSSSGTRYLIEGPHAKGGLGEVFVARDQELNRKVALKQIQERHADNPASRAQFLAEGEITGALEHPGIIPIYGLGQYADGRPFYAMRFVQGDSLLAAIERFHRAQTSNATARNLAFRDLLSRFLDVCNAVAYAHRRGVLHRDLKPGNVMLGEFGETLVIDWGMAKLLREPPARRASDGAEAAAEPTAPAEPLQPRHTPLATVGQGAHGTPGYMSPEQAAGRIDDLGAATDVYSLGAILFHILTGRPPLTRADGDVLGRTVRGELPAVRQFAPQVSQSLEAICRKALALRPAERYETVAALAEDVRRWLADEAVRAWREPWGVRARRWIRKHPRSVGGAAAALLVGLLAALGGSVLLDAKNQRLDEADTKLQEALGKEEAARQRAEERTRLANQRFTLGLEAVKQQVFEADRLLVNRAGTQELRKAIQNHALAGLEKLLREAEKSQGQDATHVRAWAHFALGDVYLFIDGRTERARREYQLAFDLCKQRAQADPRDAQAQRDLSVSHSKIGDVLLQQGEVGQALTHYQDALQISKQRAQADPRDALAQSDLSFSHNRIGDVLRRQGEVGQALTHYQDALQISKQFAEADPKDAQAQRDLSVSFEKIGNVLLQQGEVGAALTHYQDGLKNSKKRAEADPKDAQAQRDLSVSHSKIGDVLLQQGEVGQALTHYQDALQISKQRAQADPRDALAQSDLSFSHNRIGDVLRRQGEVGQALTHCQDALQISKKRAEADPKDAQAQRDLSVSHSKIGDVLLQQGEVGAALTHYQDGLKIRKQLAEADPRDAQAQRDLSISHNKIGGVLLQQGEVGQALTQFQEGLKIRKKLAEADPRNFEAQTDLVVSHFKLGRTLEQAFRHPEAVTSFENALAVLRPLQQAGKLKGTRFATWPGVFEGELRQSQEAVKALGNLDAVLTVPPKEVSALLALRAQLLVHQDKHADAVIAADKLAELAKTADQLMFAATAFAWCSRDKANQERHAGRALALLGKARDAGFFKDPKTLAALKRHEAFQPLLARDDFKKLLADLEKK